MEDQTTNAGKTTTTNGECILIGMQATMDLNTIVSGALNMLLTHLPGKQSAGQCGTMDPVQIHVQPSTITINGEWALTGTMVQTDSNTTASGALNMLPTHLPGKRSAGQCGTMDHVLSFAPKTITTSGE